LTTRAKILLRSNKTHPLIGPTGPESVGGWSWPNRTVPTPPQKTFKIAGKAHNRKAFRQYKSTDSGRLSQKEPAEGYLVFLAGSPAREICPQNALARFCRHLPGKILQRQIWAVYARPAGTPVPRLESCRLVRLNCPRTAALNCLSAGTAQNGKGRVSAMRKLVLTALIALILLLLLATPAR
jgi:hypothetical protein